MTGIPSSAAASAAALTNISAPARAHAPAHKKQKTSAAADNAANALVELPQLDHAQLAGDVEDSKLQQVSPLPPSNLARYVAHGPTYGSAVPGSLAAPEPLDLVTPSALSGAPSAAHLGHSMCGRAAMDVAGGPAAAAANAAGSMSMPQAQDQLDVAAGLAGAYETGTGSVSLQAEPGGTAALPVARRLIELPDARPVAEINAGVKPLPPLPKFKPRPKPLAKAKPTALSMTIAGLSKPAGGLPEAGLHESAGALSAGRQGSQGGAVPGSKTADASNRHGHAGADAASATAAGTSKSIPLTGQRQRPSTDAARHKGKFKSLWDLTVGKPRAGGASAKAHHHLAEAAFAATAPAAAGPAGAGGRKSKGSAKSQKAEQSTINGADPSTAATAAAFGVDVDGVRPAHCLGQGNAQGSASTLPAGQSAHDSPVQLARSSRVQQGQPQSPGPTSHVAGPAQSHKLNNTSAPTSPHAVLPVQHAAPLPQGAAPSMAAAYPGVPVVSHPAHDIPTALLMGSMPDGSTAGARNVPGIPNPSASRRGTTTPKTAHLDQQGHDVPLANQQEAVPTVESAQAIMPAQAQSPELQTTNALQIAPDTTQLADDAGAGLTRAGQVPVSAPAAAAAAINHAGHTSAAAVGVSEAGTITALAPDIVPQPAWLALPGACPCGAAGVIEMFSLMGMMATLLSAGLLPEQLEPKLAPVEQWLQVCDENADQVHACLGTHSSILFFRNFSFMA